MLLTVLTRGIQNFAELKIALWEFPLNKEVSWHKSKECRSNRSISFFFFVGYFVFKIRCTLAFNVYLLFCNKNVYIIIVLINGCFHNGPVICPRLVIMAQGRLYWPDATPWANTTFRGPLWLNRGHITDPLWKHPFLNTFINQPISILGNLHSFWRRP
jgi:hypothetical protein